MADSFADFGRKLDKLGSLLSGGEMRRMTERVARKAKPVAAAAVEPKTLSHWGKGARMGGHTVRARYEMKSGSTAALYPTVAPLAALLEKGSGTTWKAPRRRGAPRRKRGTVATYTRTRVPARYAWTHAAEAVTPVVPRFYDEELVRILREIF